MPQQHSESKHRIPIPNQLLFALRKLEEVKEELYDVHKIHGSSYAFAAIRADGQVGWQG